MVWRNKEIRAAMKPCLDTEAYNLPETVDSPLYRIAPSSG